MWSRLLLPLCIATSLVAFFWLSYQGPTALLSSTTNSDLSSSVPDQRRIMKAAIAAANLLPNAFDAPMQAFSNTLSYLRSTIPPQTTNEQRNSARQSRLWSGRQPIALQPPSVRRLLPRPAPHPAQYYQASDDQTESIGDIDRGEPTRIASFRIDPVLRRPVEAHFRVEVYCPAYRAPQNGTVSHNGRAYRGATGKIPGTRKYWQPFGANGQSFPLATSGDIKAGDVVQISCDEHFRLSDTGSASPSCLSSGEFEQGKTCIPIMCPPYQAPAHGRVAPSGPVVASMSVRISCEPPFVLDLQAGATSATPACLDTGTYQPGATCEAYSTPVAGTAAYTNRASAAAASAVAAASRSQEYTSAFIPEVSALPRCPPYVAPSHGSVWYDGLEHKISSPSSATQVFNPAVSCALQDVSPRILHTRSLDSAPPRTSARVSPVKHLQCSVQQCVARAVCKHCCCSLPVCRTTPPRPIRNLKHL